MDTKKLLNFIAQAISDKKGFNLLALEIGSLSAMSEYLVIAEGFVDRHLSSIASFLIDELAKEGIKPLKTEEGDSWVVLDFGQIIVHLFLPEARERYQLEKVWEKGMMVPLEFQAADPVEAEYL